MSTFSHQDLKLIHDVERIPGHASLQPILASSNPRYSASVQRDHNIAHGKLIPRLTRIPSLSSGAPPLPDGWEELVTPEGKAYFHHATCHVITDSDIRIPEIALRLMQGFQQLTIALGDLDNADSEAYLTIGPGDIVDYYCVDHVHRQIFWVEPITTDDLGLQPYENAGFLKSALTSEYWTHLDYFPSHQRLEENAERELLNVMRYYCADDMTSPGSTSPYGAAECQQYIRLLESFQASKEATDYRTATVARLWTSIARVRHINAYGLQFPRLDRLQGLSQYSSDQAQRSVKLSVGEVLCFNRSLRIFDQLTALWNGRVVYQRHWHTFFSSMNLEWFRMGGLSLGILLLNGMMLAVGRSSTALVASTSLAGSAIFSALFLQHAHSGGRLATAPDISSYIMKVEHLQHGLRPLSIIFAIPHALTAYSSLCLFFGLLVQSLERTTTLIQSIIITSAWCLPFSVTFFLASVL